MTISDGFKSNSDKAKFDSFCIQNNTVLFSNYLSNGYLNNSKHIFYEQVGIFYMFSVLYNGYLSSKVLITIIIVVKFC